MVPRKPGGAGEVAPKQSSCPSRFIASADQARLAWCSYCQSRDRRSDAYASAGQQELPIVRRWISRAGPGNAGVVGAHKKNPAGNAGKEEGSGVSSPPSLADGSDKLRDEPVP
jgi:hypothetical protein